MNDEMVEMVIAKQILENLTDAEKDKILYEHFRKRIDWTFRDRVDDFVKKEAENEAQRLLNTDKYHDIIVDEIQKQVDEQIKDFGFIKRFIRKRILKKGFFEI